MNQLKKYVKNFTKQQSFASEGCFDFQRDWVEVRFVLLQIAYYNKIDNSGTYDKKIQIKRKINIAVIFYAAGKLLK